MKWMRRLRVYADTSVYGGCFDEEFKKASRAFFREVSGGRFGLVVSETVQRELAEAPEEVKQVLAGLDMGNLEFIDSSSELTQLRDAYLQAGILGGASQDDAEHIAAASVAEVDLVVSWNFKHIVHFDKIAGFGAVNLLHDYKPLRIHAPQEVVEL